MILRKYAKTQNRNKGETRRTNEEMEDNENDNKNHNNQHSAMMMAKIQRRCDDGLPLLVSKDGIYLDKPICLF